MTFVAALLGVTLALYGGFFYLLSVGLDIGTPRDAVWAAVHRTWVGASGTLLLLVAFIFLRLADVSPDTNQRVELVLLWLLRIAVWTWVNAHVYRVTRWRKGKLAACVLAGLVLNVGVDLALARLGTENSFLPTFGGWVFRLV